MLTDDIDSDKLLEKIEYIGDKLYGYTEKLVFSFADIAMYRKVKSNLEKNGVPYHEWTKSQMVEFAEGLVALNCKKSWNYQLATCGEAENLEDIEHNHCVDDALIIRRAFNDTVLMDFLKVKMHQMPHADLFGECEPLPEDAIILPNGMYVTRGDNRDKGQREFCGCMKSKDIGQYNTCVHLCEYCYANTSKSAAIANYKQHQTNPFSDTITGE